MKEAVGRRGEWENGRGGRGEVEERAWCGERKEGRGAEVQVGGTEEGAGMVEDMGSLERVG